MLLSIPLLKRIRLKSDNSLALVCRQGVGDFFLKTGLVDHIFEIKKGDGQSYKKIISELNSLNLAEVFVPHQSLRTHFFISNLRAQKKIGYASWWNFLFFDQRIKRDKTLPDAIRQLSLLSGQDQDLAKLISEYKSAGQAYVVNSKNQMSAPPSWASMSMKEKLIEDKSTWSRWLEKSGLSAYREKPWVSFFPGSVWNTKRWTEEGFIELAKNIQNLGHQVLLMGAPEESDLCKRIHFAVPGSHMLAGQTSIYESALVLAHCALVVGNDSASMHLASAAEAPLVAVFGPTVVEFGYRPWSQQAYLAQNNQVSCRPCGPHGHHKCPIGTHACMKDLSAQKVLEVTQEIL